VQSTSVSDSSRGVHYALVAAAAAAAGAAVANRVMQCTVALPAARIEILYVANKRLFVHCIPCMHAHFLQVC
jgi:hypothetical protein